MPRLSLGLGVQNIRKAGGGASFSPADLSGLSMWLKADAGVSTSPTQFISQIVLTGAGTTTSNGTYTRTSGGTTFFASGGANSIGFDSYSGFEFNFLLYDDDFQDNTYSVVILNNQIATINVNNGASPAPTASITLSTTGSSGVTSWIDQSPSALTFSADLLTPDITFNSNYTNGKPAVIFGSAWQGGSMALANSGVFVTKSVFLVVAPNGSNFEYAVPYENNGLNIYTTSANYTAPWGSYLNTNANALTILNANGQKYLLSATSDTGEDAQFYLNGTNNTDFSGAGFYNERGEIVIGNGGARGSTNQQFEGAIMEIVAYDRVLTTIEREQVEAYLNTKYAIY